MLPVGRLKVDVVAYGFETEAVGLLKLEVEVLGLLEEPEDHEDLLEDPEDLLEDHPEDLLDDEGFEKPAFAQTNAASTREKNFFIFLSFYGV